MIGTQRAVAIIVIVCIVFITGAHIISQVHAQPVSRQTTLVDVAGPFNSDFYGANDSHIFVAPTQVSHLVFLPNVHTRVVFYSEAGKVLARIEHVTGQDMVIPMNRIFRTGDYMVVTSFVENGTAGVNMFFNE